MRFLFWIVFMLASIAFGWQAFQEMKVVAMAILATHEEYSFQKEIFVWSHIFYALLWMIPTVLFFGVADHISDTPEERRRMKELLQRQKSEEVRRAMRPESAGDAIRLKYLNERR